MTRGVRTPTDRGGWWCTRCGKGCCCPRACRGTLLSRTWSGPRSGPSCRHLHPQRARERASRITNSYRGEGGGVQSVRRGEGVRCPCRESKREPVIRNPKFGRRWSGPRSGPSCRSRPFRPDAEKERETARERDSAFRVQSC